MIIHELIERFLPGKSDVFCIEIDSSSCADFYELSARDGKILLLGNSPLSAAMAFNAYLKTHLHACITWCEDSIVIPLVLPLPKEKTHCDIPQKYRAYMNYCTYSYSCAHWDFERWKREIDFMALNGINLPMTIVGTELTWFLTLLQFGFDEKEALAFISAPAFWAWQLMSNLEGEYPLIDKACLMRRYELGKKIIDRMVEYGMTPIQQGFSGYVPTKLKEKYPSADIRIGKKWCGYDGTALLNPADPLFARIGQVFLQTHESLFGKHRFYACDPFHESTPPVAGRAYLKRVGTIINTLYKKHNPESIWVMQGWTPKAAIIRAVPKERLLILDLTGNNHKKFRNYYGYPFVLGVLHNFGGRIDLHGDIHNLASNRYLRAKRCARGVTGTGLFMEGIVQNPLFYDLAFEMLTSSASRIDLETWLKDYALRRYGSDSPQLKESLLKIAKCVYGKVNNEQQFSSMICARPALNVKKSGPNLGFRIPYSNDELYNAAHLFLKEQLSNSAYIYDAVDIVRQLFSNLLQDISKEIRKSYNVRNKALFEKMTSMFMSILYDVDRMLAPIPQLSFYSYIEESRLSAHTPEEAKRNVASSSALLTVWGPSNGIPEIFDYAWREWGGMINEFYAERWKRFFEMLLQTLKSGKYYSEKRLPKCYGRESFRANSFYEELAAFELEWVRRERNYQNMQFDYSPLDAAQTLLEKYDAYRKELK